VLQNIQVDAKSRIADLKEKTIHFTKTVINDTTQRSPHELSIKVTAIQGSKSKLLAALSYNLPTKSFD